MTDFNEAEAKLEALLDVINSSARQAIAEYKKTGHGVPSADATTFHPLDLTTDTLALKKSIRLLEGAYHQLSSILAPPQHTVMNYVFNYNWACTSVVLQARIADVLDRHPEGLSVDKLAEAVNLDKTKTARVLRALSIMGCFKEVERDVFANTRQSLVLKSSNNVGCFAKLHSRDVSKYAAVLYETMTDDEFSRSHETDKAPSLFTFKKEGMKGNYWDYINNDDDSRDEFHRAMLGLTEMNCASAVLHHYPWDDISSVVDIGSGIGAFSTPLAKMFPHLKITNQDIPEVMIQAQTAWEKNAPEALLDGRVDFVPINFLENVPVVGKDVYYLRHIIHNWRDTEATMILRNIRKAMGPNSRVLIHDPVIFHTLQQPDMGTDKLSVAPEPMLPNFGAGSHRTFQTDLTMWLLLNSKERTLDELKVIGAAAGLTLTQVYDFVETTVMEFRIAQD
ncbi:S-adenosyl-L-methionine-dependent methyltransferase [Suillus clintonianus]|uniref:S-adenosyl-L-methionine-dependent methyltransferase n=1 Tax=Suillus clintonianus TaxID=1904413 RepID=UPI001B86A419|nr:S-adenosyl-L-methionine-dependent methyltransferase [Suillus clintonianus]KAG2126909.1 S-adenosyl-L-methionine-dependent methyltransferase [Suillus clintonianus]